MDQKLFQIQKKMEMMMHSMVHPQGKQDHSLAEMVGAFARSAWEDIQQQRRSPIARREKSKLDIREDDSGGQLLSKEEGEKVAKGQTARAQQQFLYHTQLDEKIRIRKCQAFNFATFPPTNKQGERKGKGRGKGNNSL